MDRSIPHRPRPHRPRPRRPRPRRPAALAAIALALTATVACGALTGTSALAAQHGPATNDRTAVPAAPAGATAPAGHSKRAVKRHYSLAAAAFAPDGLHDTTEDYFNEWDPAALSNTDPGRCFNAALSLPLGATMVSVTVYYTAGSDVMFFDLSRQDLANHSAVDLVTFDTAVAATPADASQTRPIPAADAVADMNGYAYTAGVCPIGNTTFSGITITYTQPAG